MMPDGSNKSIEQPVLPSHTHKPQHPQGRPPMCGEGAAERPHAARGREGCAPAGPAPIGASTFLVGTRNAVATHSPDAAALLLLLQYREYFLRRKDKLRERRAYYDGEKISMTVEFFDPGAAAARTVFYKLISF